ncbi:MAG TPA: hypothetical protein VN906_08125 [Candidatus Sulfotelmatobacter sp.]|nr:hypothetical protein [Candidatus Sulfotelmatobacter sp.]
MRTALSAYFALTAMTLAQGSLDLAEILAPPPSADYTDAASSDTVLNGPFNAHQYAVWLAATQSDISRFEGVFNQEGFKHGYARSWVALSPTKASPGADRHNRLVETVEEYGSGNGAQARYAGVLSYTRGGANGFVHEIETSIPHAFAALIFGGFVNFVMFVKGNDVYIVRMSSDLDDMSAATVHQGHVQFGLAPAYTIPPDQWLDPQPPQTHDEFSAAKATALVKGSLLGVLLIGRLLLFINHVRRRLT